MIFQSKKIYWLASIVLHSMIVLGQSNPDDYWLNHPVSPFISGQTIITNSGFFYDDGGFDLYGIDQDWSVRFCSENGNPITVDFNGFRTDYRGIFPDPPPGAYLEYDYMKVIYQGISYYAVYNDDTPQLSFTSPDGCIDFSFRSQSTSLQDSGWIAEISANPSPANNDPCTATSLPVGNVCSPSYFSNKGAYNTTNLGNPSCHTYFGGDVWFTAVVPASGQLKIESFPGTLDYAIMVLYTGACNSLTQRACVDIPGSMPSIIITRPAGELVTIRIFGDQAKSGTFGICATDPTAPITGYTGPGGVGDSISNVLWLRGDKGTLNNSENPALPADPVKIWKDQSGNASDISQSVLLHMANFSADVIAGNPGLQFDGTNDYYMAEIGNLAAPVSIFTVKMFMIDKDQTLLTLGDATDNNTLSISREIDNKYYSFTGVKRYGPNIPGAAPLIFFANHSITSPYHNLKINSVNQAVSDYPGFVSTDGSLYLGASKGLSGFFNGRLGEVIMYNKALNQAQEIIVHNYLSSKYGIDIGASNKYIYDDIHKYDLAGIGRVNATNIHSKAQSAGILAIGGAVDLENDEFLLFGHDGNSISSWVSAGVPGDDVNLLRMERTWRVNMTGGDGVGNVTISIKDSLLAAPDFGFLSYNIFVSGDGNFSSNASVYGVIKSGNEFVANNVELNNGDFITIGVVRPFVSFAVTASSGFENIANPQIEVSLNYAISEPSEVSYAVASGTAAGGGVDYSLSPGTLVFNPGQKTQYIIPLVIDDDEVEIPDEYFVIELSNPTSGVQLGDTTTHTYTILNNDIDIVISVSDTLIGACDTSITTLSASASGTGPFNYSWSPVNGLSHPDEAVTSANPSVTTTYRLTVADVNGFTEEDSVVITVEPLPLKPVITPSGSVSFVYGDSVTLTSSAGDSYIWSTGDTTQSVTVKLSGTFSVQVIDIYGCISESSDELTVTVSTLGLTITADPGQGKIYGETDPALAYSITSGALLPGDSLSGSLTRVSGESAGTYAILQGTLTAGFGYTITFESDDFIIYPKTLGIGGSFTVFDKVYDGNTDAVIDENSLSLTGISGTDDVFLIASASFDTKDTGTGKSVSLNISTVLGGIDKNNYILSLAGAPVTSAKITSKEISIGGSFSVFNKVYDGNSDASINVNSLNLTGLLTGEDVVLNPVAAFDSKHVGSGKTVSLNSFSYLSGADKDNYTLTIAGSPVSFADITVRTLTLSNFTADDKHYDGTTSVNGSGFDDDRIPGDILEFTYDAVFEDENVGENKMVYFINITISGGADKENYILGSTSGTAIADIKVCAISAIDISPSGPISICEGESVMLTAENAFSYLWSTGETTQSIVVSVSGVYTLSVKDESGCESPESEPVTVTVNPLPVVEITKTDVSCFGGTDGIANASVIGGVSPYSYNWSNGANTPLNAGIGAGTYSLTVSDANTCEGTAQVTIAQPPQIIVTAVTKIPYCPDSPDGEIRITSTGGTGTLSYLWENGFTLQDRLGIKPGTYTLELRDENDCLVTETITLSWINDVCIMIPDIITPNGDGWNDEWVIERLDLYPDATVEIYNRWGKRIFFSKGYEIYWDGTFDGRELPMDSYHYIINLKNGTPPLIGNVTIVR